MDKHHIIESVQIASNSQLKLLKDQMERNSQLAHTLTVPLGQLIQEQPKYRFLALEAHPQLINKNATLYKLICHFFSNRKENMGNLFIKTSTGLFAGFVVLWFNIDENFEGVVDDILLFSFGLSPKEDEDMIRKDMPRIIERALKNCTRVRWTAHKENKANIAYEIYIKRHGGIRNAIKGGWEYVVYKNTFK
jgi:hypothetical protein